MRIKPAARPRLVLTANDNFPQRISCQKELKRRGFFEKPLYHSIGKELTSLPGTARHLRQRLLILNTVVVNGYSGRMFIGIKEHQHQTARFHDAYQLADYLIDQRARQKLQGVPDEYQVERFIVKSKRLIQKALRIGGGLL